MVTCIYIAGCFIMTIVVCFRASSVANQNQNKPRQIEIVRFPWSSTRSLHCILRSTQVLPVHGCWRQWQWAYPYLGVTPVGEVLPQRQGYKRALETQRK